MRSLGSLLATLSVALLLAAPVRAADDGRGKMLFEQNCSACHGLNAKGVQGLGKDLTTSKLVADKSDEEMVSFIIEGRGADHPENTTGILMPPRAGNPSLTDEDLGAIVAHLRTLHVGKDAKGGK